MSFPSVPQLPDASGHYGSYGGKFVPETLMQPLDELEQAYLEARQDPTFQAELKLAVRKLFRQAHAPISCRPADPPFGRGKNLFETGRSQSHRGP